MMYHSKLLLVACLLLSKLAYNQHVDEGYFNDWDYGPTGVYGNYRLTKTTSRAAFKIAKDGHQKVVVTQFNPSGIVVNVAIISFINGILSGVNQANQWGEIYEYRHYERKDTGVFRFTDFLRGKNAFFPAKYALCVYTGELLAEVQYYSASGVLQEDKYGVAITRYKRYDDLIRFAERKETSFFGVQQQPVISKATGYHKLSFEYDQQDNKITESYADIHDAPTTLPQHGIAKILFTYDSNNNVIREEYHGLEDKVVSNAYGVAGFSKQYEMGYLMKTTRLDTAGKPTRSQAAGDGVSIIKFEYDTAGNQIREAFFDENEKPMRNHSGVQEIARFFSGGNTLTRVTYFDEFGRPCVDRDKINSIVYIRDEKNRPIQEANYGLNGQPLKTYTEEVYMIKTKYDLYGRQVSHSFWADSNTRMPHWDGSYGTGTQYNEDGLVTAYSSFDENGNPFKTEDGSSTMKLVYNANGRLEERQFLHYDQLVNRKGGVTYDYSITKYEHDDADKVIELTFWATEQQPVNAVIWVHDSVSAHRIAFTYRGNRVIEQRYYKLGAKEPFRIIDCLKSDYISPSGISTGRKIEN